MIVPQKEEDEEQASFLLSEEALHSQPHHLDANRGTSPLPRPLRPQLSQAPRGESVLDGFLPVSGHHVLLRRHNCPLRTEAQGRRAGRRKRCHQRLRTSAVASADVSDQEGIRPVLGPARQWWPSTKVSTTSTLLPTSR